MQVNSKILNGVVAVAAGASHTIALKSDGTVWAWGYNGYGQLGDGTMADRYAPVQVSGLSGVTAIAGGWFYTVALKSDGTVWAWGDNSSGQLGGRDYDIQENPSAGKRPERCYRHCSGRWTVWVSHDSPKVRRNGVGVGMELLRPIG